ncbi:MAG: APC family permease [Phycisphaerales bacterium JB060]
MTDRPTHEQPQRGTLHRELRFRDALMFGVGGMLGAGIYAIIGEATQGAGNLLWLSLTLAAVVAIITGFTYAELVSMFPDAGGGYEYVAQAFGRTFAAWAAILLLGTGVIAAAAISIAFADYLGRLVDINARVIIVGILVLVTGFNVWGAGESSWFNTVATIATVLGLLVVIGFGLPHLGEADLLGPAPGGWVGISAAAALAFFSFVGFEDLVKMAEEVKEPRKNLPRALIASTLIVTVIYALVAISAVSILDHEKLAESNGPLSAVMREAWGPIGGVGITIVALFATSKTVLTNVMGNSRLLMDVARDHNKLSFLSYVAPKVHTPVVALGLTFVVTLAFALIGNLGLVASISNFCVFTAFILVNAALIKLHVARPELREQQAFRVPLHLPLGRGRVPLLPCVSIVLLLALIVANFRNLLG